MAEYADIVQKGRFDIAPGMMEGKWFADTPEGVAQHAAAHYPNGDCRIVATDVPDEWLERLHRPDNLDGYGPATYLEMPELDLIAPILEGI